MLGTKLIEGAADPYFALSGVILEPQRRVACSHLLAEGGLEHLGKEIVRPAARERPQPVPRGFGDQERPARRQKLVLGSDLRQALLRALRPRRIYVIAGE